MLLLCVEIPLVVASPGPSRSVCVDSGLCPPPGVGPAPGVSKSYIESVIRSKLGADLCMFFLCNIWLISLFCSLLIESHFLCMQNKKFGHMLRLFCWEGGKRVETKFRMREDIQWVMGHTWVIPNPWWGWGGGGRVVLSTIGAPAIRGHQRMQGTFGSPIHFKSLAKGKIIRSK